MAVRRVPVHPSLIRPAPTDEWARQGSNLRPRGCNPSGPHRLRPPPTTTPADRAPRTTPRGSRRFVRLLGDLRMRGARRDNPDDPSLLIGAVPDSATGGDLVLPLRQCPTADLTFGELTTQPVLTRPVLRLKRPLGQHDPRLPRVGLRHPAQLLPPLRRVGGRKPRLPSVRASRRCDAITSLRWHRSRPGRRRHRPEIIVQRPGELGHERGIGVDSRGRLPLDEDLRQH